MTEPQRRASDTRIDRLNEKLDLVVQEVGQIRRLLDTEPEASALGRQLVRRSAENRSAIERLERRFDKFLEEDWSPLEDWWNQTKGAWRFVLGAGAVLGIIGTFFGVAAYFGIGPG